ncbi:MAG: hypothetical protein A2700_01860 [Candidatus Blackburnbacteria bacterium RIFCSPHIGHO2_01_FULL_44_64]|uniref:R3H domain-containing protein n=1 Tax=Candidatus Blackburnbacteria bacterium RIFCSPHIGHO2_02_FULL_44_20 TaxID=1797516 RepID=A0A1G1V554_9BACT|nr:MAG: hypothetical protein A2700_01860 [Candidatus Blackburnbacteria bacterium RIFCSPHIGHO2_01_FULL_44_64]OGY10524.1 MAG: hypothetical protein A3D26_00290 [Candidatus Blackburnbacteria bacterium RIFCSPHIGHO2_02_FULL_44_20]OGY12266.1 MAG: hypothetical protein A3E16_01975 [Candidatus Blackburnbacteria bacterium RIFCSPHIGHO2_12_FULL_44_25]OGY14881.1 MAG: hypothetical protein A3A62_00780 [Candidatus Blackburnbacteria bacterium RIFCSPLOWO2_01_FULL_44_43]OGY15404.1 MAG: hypothetical protein A3H88_0
MVIKKAVKKKVMKASVRTVSELIRSEAERILELVGIQGSVEVTQDMENELYTVQVDTDQAAILIGHRGETLASFQTVLRQVVYQQTSLAARVVVNVGDWRDKREEVVRSLASSAAGKVRATSIPQHLYDLSPSERRVVHMMFSEDPGVVSESEGEGRERHLVLKPRL